MAELSRTDPRVQAAARALEITMIQRAWDEDGVLYVQDPFDVYEIAAVVQEGKTDTLPKDADGEDFISYVQPGIDDFTAITGVGSVTAQKLHNLELYTYDDLRVWLARLRAEDGAPDAEDYEISDHTVGQIEDWLNARLV